ncbi:MAG TPA: hypothetical protein VGL42_01045 [Opitutaceae bacterium]|jgi:hypothetical protein
MIRRITLLAVVSAVLAATPLFAQMEFPGEGLNGHIEGRTYYSATGEFSVHIPVLAALNGTVGDTPNQVIFADPISTYITIVCYPFDAAERGKLDVQGPKQYLQEYFYNYVWRSFSSYPGARYETDARFQPHLFDGAFFTYIDLPGGSEFYPPEYRLSFDTPPPVAKRGNLMFIHGDIIYVISMELAERMTHANHYNLSSEEEDILLRDRLTAFANTIHFLTPASQ